MESLEQSMHGSLAGKTPIVRWTSCIRACIVLSASLVLSFSSFCPAIGEESAESTVTSLITLLTKPVPDVEGVRKATRQYIDYDGMAQLVLGTSQWRRLNSRQRSEFSTAMRELVEQRYITRWQKIFKNGSMRFLSESQRGRELYIEALLTLGKKKDRLVWHLSSQQGDPKVVSLSVNGRDLSGILAKRLRNYLTKHGFNELIAWMRKVQPTTHS